MIRCDETKPYIFISYSHRDTEKVLEIIERLKAEGFNVWYDEGIDPGTEWDNNIANHIIGCSYFIGFVSDNYIKSDNCRDEVNYSRDKKKPQLLVYFEDVDIPEGMQMRMNRIQAIYWNKYKDEQEAYSKLFLAEGINVAKISEANEEEVAQLIEEEKEKEKERRESAKAGGNSKTKAKKPFPWKLCVPIAAVLLIVGAFLAGIMSSGNAEKKLAKNIDKGMEYLYYAEGREINPEKAYECFEIAGNAGDKLAQFLQGYVLVTVYTEANKDCEKGISLLEGVKDDIPWAYFVLAYAYKNGLGVEWDTEKSKECAETFLGLIDKEEVIEDTSSLNGLYFNCLAVAYNITEDRTSAIKWAEKSADTDFVPGINTLGALYFSGDGMGVDADITKALEMFEKAGEAGYAVAIFNNGLLYYQGKVGDEPDYEKAEKYFERSSKLGYAKAKYYLGLIEQYGEIRTVNYQKAYEYYSEAAELGYAAAMRKLGDFHYYTDYSEVAENNNDTAASWYEKAASKGDATAMYKLGCIYYYGKIGNEPDYASAFEWFMKASDNGHAEAANYVGIIIEDGLVEGIDIKDAIDSYVKAADNGNYNAMYNLGLIYQFNENYKDMDKALEWFEKAAEAGSVSACTKLGALYYYGNSNVEIDKEKGLKYYQLGADKGNVSCLYDVGMIEYNNSNYSVAEEYFLKVVNSDKATDDEKGAAYGKLGAIYYTNDVDEAVSYFETGVSYGNSYSAAMLSIIYLSEELYKDYSKAFECATMAAEAGNYSGMTSLGDIYRYGYGKSVDINEAFYWYTTATKAGSSYAAQKLYVYAVEIIETSDNLDDYEDTLFKAFEAASDAGVADAMAYMGYFYQYGAYVEQDTDKAVSLYEEAGDRGSSIAMKLLGDYYWEQDGADYKSRAIGWYKKASEAGSDVATLNLVIIYYFGNNVTKNIDTAYKYYKILVDKNATKMLEQLAGYGIVFEE